MLVADDDDVSFFSAVSHHLRANDGSCFDLDPRGSNAGPSKAASIRRVGLNAALAVHDGNRSDGMAANGREDCKVNAGPQEASRATADALIEPEARATSQRPPSIVIDSKLASSGAVAPAADAGKVETATPSGLGAVPTTRTSFLATPTPSTFQASRPNSARMLPSGIGKPARALYDFEGEAAFNELAIRAGQSFDILKRGTSRRLESRHRLGRRWCAETRAHSARLVLPRS